MAVRPLQKVFVAGHNGMAGSAIVRQLCKSKDIRLVLRSHAELDLTDQASVRKFFNEERPDQVYLAAAKVGGIQANNQFPADFIRTNLLIQTLVIEEAFRAGVRRLLFLGSSCIYPRDCPQPIREEYLLTGPLEPTNRPYALAKIAGIEQCWSYNRQHDTHYICAMPTNLYGQGDNYNLNTSHVLPALIRKCHEAKMAGNASFTAWGTGSPLREFLHCDDLARACVHLMERASQDDSLVRDSTQPPIFNVGSGQDLSIRDLTTLVARTVGYTGHIEWDASKPDGTPRKLLDVSRMATLGWRSSIGLEQGLLSTYAHFLESTALTALPQQQAGPIQMQAA